MHLCISTHWYCISIVLLGLPLLICHSPFLLITPPLIVCSPFSFCFVLSISASTPVGSCPSLFYIHFNFLSIVNEVNDSSFMIIIHHENCAHLLRWFSRVFLISFWPAVAEPGFDVWPYGTSSFVFCPIFWGRCMRSQQTGIYNKWFVIEYTVLIIFEVNPILCEGFWRPAQSAAMEYVQEGKRSAVLINNRRVVPVTPLQPVVAHFFTAVQTFINNARSPCLCNCLVSPHNDVTFIS